jgi:hypothetical protein
MAGHHRALSMAALTGGMTIAPTLSPHTIHGHSHGHGHGHAHNHAAARSSAAAAPTNANGDDRPKSGRLGVKRRQKYTRTRTGCLGCRARRIKCDEGRPVCRRCTVAKREVSFSFVVAHTQTV